MSWLIALGQLPSTLTPNQQLPNFSATLWWSCWVTSVLLSGKPSVTSRRWGKPTQIKWKRKENISFWKKIKIIIISYRLLWNRVLQHLFERTATPFQMFTWIAPARDYTLDCVRAEEISPVGQEEYPAGQVVGSNCKNNCRICGTSIQTLMFQSTSEAK